MEKGWFRWDLTSQTWFTLSECHLSNSFSIAWQERRRNSSTLKGQLPVQINGIRNKWTSSEWEWPALMSQIFIENWSWKTLSSRLYNKTLQGTKSIRLEEHAHFFIRKKGQCKGSRDRGSCMGEGQRPVPGFWRWRPGSATYWFDGL